MKKIAHRFSLLTSMVTLAVLALTSCQSDNGYPLDTHYLPVQLAGSTKWSILDTQSGNIVARDAFAAAPSPVVDGMFYIINDDGTYSYYDVANPTTPISSDRFGSATVFSTDGLAIASRRGSPLCIINRKGETLKTLPRDIQQCSMFQRGMAAYQNDQGLWGFLDTNGDTIVTARYGSVNPFLHCDLAIVTDPVADGDSIVTFSVIDKRGNVKFTASSAQYTLIEPYFVDGVLPVIKGDTLVCLDSNGHETANPNDDHNAVEKGGWDTYKRTAGGYFITIKKGLSGLVDSKNTTLIPAKYNTIVDLTPDRYVVMVDSVAHLVDRQGNPVGDARFVHIHGSIDQMMATRGFVDTDLVAAAMLSMCTPAGACGATPATTVMDINSLLPSDATPYVGHNAVAVPQGPLTVRYIFNNDIASATSAGASYNLDARVMCVAITANVGFTGLDTEPIIITKLAKAMGTIGFVFDNGTIFRNEQAGTAIATGYNEGLVNLLYYMNGSYAQQLPRNPRK